MHASAIHMYNAWIRVRIICYTVHRYFLQCYSNSQRILNWFDMLGNGSMAWVHYTALESIQFDFYVHFMWKPFSSPLWLVLNMVAFFKISITSESFADYFSLHLICLFARISSDSWIHFTFWINSSISWPFNR